MLRLFKKIKSLLFPSKQSKRVKPWFLINGDKTLRLTYPLNEHSVVFDLGGYEGQWTSDIFAKYQCTIFVFEPFEKYYQNIKDRFAFNNKIKVFDYGLGNGSKTLTLYFDDDSTSSYKRKGNAYEIKIVKAMEFMKRYGIQHIDLMKINIEGGEYDLFDELIEQDIAKSIKNIQVQFHDFVPDAKSRMLRIQNSLKKTHRLTYHYEFVWENWELK